MAKQENTQSLANGQGEVFSVGEGVHWGFNGDVYPGTVRRVSPSGRKIWVSSDAHRITQVEKDRLQEHGLHDGEINCVFIPRDVPESEWKCFTLRKTGCFTERPGRSIAFALHRGRHYHHTPSL